MPSKGSSSQSSSLTPHVFQIHVNYERMENYLRVMQDVLMVEREDNRAMSDLWATYNAHMQVFMVVRKKNTFVAFLTFRDMYVC
jgi:hypothetical protein